MLPKNALFAERFLIVSHKRSASSGNGRTGLVARLPAGTKRDHKYRAGRKSSTTHRGSQSKLSNSIKKDEGKRFEPLFTKTCCGRLLSKVERNETGLIEFALYE